MEFRTSRSWGSLVEIVGVFGIGLAIVVTGLQFTGDNAIARQMVVWIANIAVIAAVVLMLRRRGETVAHLGLQRLKISPRALFKLIGVSLITFMFAVVAFIVGSIIMANITGVPESADLSSYEFLSDNLPMLLLTLSGVFVASSFGEEFVYRGFLTTRTAEMLGGQRAAWIAAVVISSVVFGLAHYDWGLMGIVQTTFMGAALAISWLKAGKNLWVVILAHAYMDFILMMQIYLA